MTQLKASYDAGLKEYENMKSSVYDYIQELYDTGSSRRNSMMK